MRAMNPRGIRGFVKLDQASMGDIPTPEPQYTYQSEDGKIATNSADQAYADITRANWDDFEQNDLPYLMETAQMFTDDSYIDKAVNQAKEGINQGFSLADANNSNRLAGMGVEQSADQQRISDRRMAIAKNASLADAMNSARDSAKDRQLSLISGTNFSGVGG